MTVYRQFHSFLEQRRLWNLFTYLFFGCLATVVNIVSYTLVFDWARLSWPVSNSISWLASVLFAFVTNKLWVFHTRTNGFRASIWEFTKFMMARIASYGLDMLCMWLMIDFLTWHGLIAKVITQVIVVIVNYVLSKLLIFTVTDNDEKTKEKQN
ncbi:GtrA family protein [Lacticaseibacillus paracasei]|uniref:GtrA family protein n=1 Tax=Lacticaseibacillus paracasei TaxID=1597 RepID=UPI000F0B1492|nr:GtrA family protein [Lacticaseibacillus paracasei]RND51690.1 GtrA-like protein [Lacticaseibacillus paracasei]